MTNKEKLGISNHSSRDKEGFLLGRYVGWNLNDWQGGKEMVPHWLRVLQRRFWKIFFYTETKCKSWTFVLSLQFDYEVSVLTWEYDMFNFKDGLIKRILLYHSYLSWLLSSTHSAMWKYLLIFEVKHGFWIMYILKWKQNGLKSFLKEYFISM